MAVTARVFGPAAQSLLRGEFGDVTLVAPAAGAVTLKALLIQGGYTAQPDARYRSELTFEVTDASYTAGGVALTNVTVTYDAVTNTTTLDCDDVTFPNLTATIGCIVFYRDTGVAATSPLLVDWVLDPAETSTTAPYVLTIAPEGLLRQVVV